MVLVVNKMVIAILCFTLEDTKIFRDLIVRSNWFDSRTPTAYSQFTPRKNINKIILLGANCSVEPMLSHILARS